MEIGVIGLGKMGSNLILNLKDHGYSVVGFDSSWEAREVCNQSGVKCCDRLEELLTSFKSQRIIWMMLPSGDITNNMIQNLLKVLDKDDILIDAGNSNYKDSIRHAAEAEEYGIKFLDVGTSGGINGVRSGACLMIGGSREVYDQLKAVFHDISTEGGCMYTGAAGSGHFMKMVHNGIEYGMMQAIGEGFQIMKRSEFDYDLREVASTWNHGSVIRSWLIELTEEQFGIHPDLKNVKGIIEASGEAKWTVDTALEMGISAPVITLALMVRNASQDEDSFSNKVVAALRNGFGGHSYQTADKE